MAFTTTSHATTTTTTKQVSRYRAFFAKQAAFQAAAIATYPEFADREAFDKRCQASWNLLPDMPARHANLKARAIAKRPSFADPEAFREECKGSWNLLAEMPVRKVESTVVADRKSAFGAMVANTMAAERRDSVCGE